VSHPIPAWTIEQEERQGRIAAVKARWAGELEKQQKLEREQRGPMLSDLVAEYGGYDRITAAGWEKWNTEIAIWKRKIRSGFWYKK
jgi:hypothetical protein